MLKDFVDRLCPRLKVQALVFSIHLAFWLTVAFLSGSKPLVWDANGYLVIFPRRFYKNNHFSLFNFDNALRGYILPAVGLVINKTAQALSVSPNTLVLILMALLFTLLTSVLIPQVTKKILPHSNTTVISIATALYMLVFWRGYLQYFLSDIPALVCFLLAINLMLSKPSYLRALAIGIFGYVSVNIRMAYLVGFIVVCVIYLARASNLQLRSFKVDLSRTFFTAIFIVLGIGLLSFPQVMTNHRTVKKFSIFPQTQYGVSEYETPDGTIPVGSSDLRIFQLSVGLGVQRYETNITPNEDARNIYTDKSGMQIVDRYLPIDSVSDYAKIVAKEPAEMVKLNTRHVLNGFDVRYDTPYITSSDKIPTVFRFLNYGFIGLFILTAGLLILRRDKLGMKPHFLLPVTVIAASSIVGSVPGAIETRFFLFPALLIFSASVASAPKVWQELKSSKTLLISGAAFLVFFVAGYNYYSNWVQQTLHLFGT